MQGHALRVAHSLGVPDKAYADLLGDVPRTARRRLLRAVVADGRSGLADRLIDGVRADWGDADAAVLLPGCTPGCAARLLPELLHAVRGWGGLGRRHPGLLLDVCGQQLAALPEPHRAEWWHRYSAGAPPPSRPFRSASSTCSNASPRPRCRGRWPGASGHLPRPAPTGSSASCCVRGPDRSCGRPHWGGASCTGWPAPRPKGSWWARPGHGNGHRGARPPARRPPAGPSRRPLHLGHGRTGRGERHPCGHRAARRPAAQRRRRRGAAHGPAGGRTRSGPQHRADRGVVPAGCRGARAADRRHARARGRGPGAGVVAAHRQRRAGRGPGPPRVRARRHGAAAQRTGPGPLGRPARAGGRGGRSLHRRRGARPRPDSR